MPTILKIAVILAVGMVSSTFSATGSYKMLLDDFSEISAQRWSYVADTVMGGVSEGTARIGVDGDIRYIKLQGTVSTDNNGGFIQVRRDFDRLPDGTKGLSVTARGNGETYHVFLRSRKGSRPWHSWRATFVATENWGTTALNLADFKPSHAGLPEQILPSDVKGIGLVAYGKDFEADLEVAEISLF